MIINNKNRKLSRNSKQRIERRNKMDVNMKSLLNKIKCETKKKIKKFDKIKNLEIELVKIKYVTNPNKLQSEKKRVE